MKNSIGMLLPISTITTMGKDFERGFYRGLESAGADLSNIEVVKEFINQGGYHDVESAVNRLFGYHAVDVITGIVSIKTVSALADKFKNKKKVIVASSLGEHLMFPEEHNEYIFINSTHLWHQCRILGKWAATKFGNSYMVASALYDGGYVFQSMFHHGVSSVHKDPHVVYTIGKMPEKGLLTDMDPILDAIEKTRPAYALALFCDREASMFLEGFYSRGLHHDTALIGLPFLLNGISEQMEGLTIFTPYYDYGSEQSAYDYNNIFDQLGFESAQMLASSLQSKAFGHPESFSGSHSSIIMSPNDPVINGPVSINRNVYTKNTGLLTEEMHTENINQSLNVLISEFKGTTYSGWLNSYLCI